MKRCSLKRTCVVMALILFFTISCCFGQDYYSQREKGWHWYQDPKEPAKVKKGTPKIVESDPIVQISTIKQTIKRALDTAILQPTPENVEHYIALQNQMTSRAQQFSENWQRALLKQPDLNYSLVHPTNNVAIQAYHEQESTQKETVIKTFSQQTGLFFFYRSTCIYCKRFAPILINFASRYGITVVPITLDGISLPEFPHSLTNTGQAAQFQVTVTPSLFAVNPYTKKAYPIAYGLTSEAELRDNIYKIMTQNQGKGL